KESQSRHLSVRPAGHLLSYPGASTLRLCRPGGDGKGRLMRAASWLVVTVLLIPERALAQTLGPAAYQSPYRVGFHHATRILIGDLLEGPRGDPKLESETPHVEWYTERFVRGERPWGPRPHLYGPPQLAEGKDASWRRERIISTALRFVGYDYQHHHIPDWA